MMPRLLDPLLSLFGFCRHRHVTWPQRRRVNGIYVGPPMQVCTVCGKTWVYDWEHMRPMKGEPDGQCEETPGIDHIYLRD